MREMDLVSFDLNLLVALNVLLQEMHVTKSAERLKVSQPAMSRILAKLRIMFNDQLLVRGPDGYLKTPHAEKLEKQLTETLRSVAQTIASPQFDPKIERTTFKICTLDYGEVVVVPKLLKLLEERAPNVVVETIQRTHYSAHEVQNGDADITLGIMPITSAKNCRMERLFDDRYVCIMARDHPLADEKLTLESYLSYGHSVTSTGSRTQRKVDQTLDALGLKRKVLKKSPHFLASIFSCQQTRLLQTTPLRHVEPLLGSMQLIAKELPFEVDAIRHCQIWHIRNNDDPAHQWFRQQVSECVSMLGKGQPATLPS